jgi:tetratricopeptide (TPR) repeat protein
MVLFLSLLAFMSPSYVWGLSLDSKAQGLAHYIMAVCHDLNGESAQAISEYQKSVKFNGLEPAPRLKLGVYYLRLYSAEHKYDLAASEYETILKIAAQEDPADTDAYMYLGQLYYAQQKYSQAIEQFLKVVRLQPKNTSALCLLGSVYAQGNDRSKAIVMFRKVLQIDPENSEALNSLGYMYAQDGVHLDEAIRMVGKAIEIDPTNGAYYDSLGWALYKKGRFQTSLMALQKAETYIEDKILYDHIGDVYKALKEYATACRYWRKSLDLDPHQILVRQKIKELGKCVVSPSVHRLN